jgi:hypothetical protein
VIKHIIDSAPERHEFWLMDIGAGNFAWSRVIRNFINSTFPPERRLRVYIYNLRGEDGSEPGREEEGACTIFNVKKCKIENLAEALASSGFSLEKQLDLCVSHRCFPNLADPLGTFVQTYNLLRPTGGLLFMDGFYFQYEKNDKTDVNYDRKMSDGNVLSVLSYERKMYNRNLLSVLRFTKAPFIEYDCNDIRLLNQFVLQRVDDNSCNLPLSYLRMEPLSRSVTRSKVCTIVRYHGNSPVLDRREEPGVLQTWNFDYSCTFFGSPGLMELLSECDEEFTDLFRQW